MKNIDVTYRHKEIIKMLHDGLKLESVARALNISPNTVRAHKQTAYNRLHVHSLDEAFLKIREMEQK
jgi:DNA-binding NarL/FixJ family response regulator